MRLLLMITLLKTMLAGVFGAGAPAPVQKGSIAPFDRIPAFGNESAAKLTLPYAKSAWVQAAIRKIVGPICSVPLQFFGDSRGGQQILTDPALAQFWQSPAFGPGRTGQRSRLKITEVIQASLGWLQLEGEFFWLLDTAKSVPFPEVAPGGGLRPFVIARPDRMRAVIQSGELTDWAYTDAGGRTFLLEPERVVHVKCWNPYNDFRGLPPTEAALMAAEADYLAGRFNLNLMQNNGDTGPIIIGKSGLPDDTQQKQITMLLREKKERSLRGEFRPVFLGGDIVVEDPQVKVPDAAFVAVRLENRHEVFIAYGVPPSMADVKAAYSIGSASDEFHLIARTCMPVSEQFADGVEEVVRRQTGKQLYAGFDWSRDPQMAAVRNERIDNGVKLWNTGYSWEKISKYLDLRLPEEQGWEVAYLPFSVAPVESVQAAGELAANPAEDPALAEEEEALPEEGKAVRSLLHVFRAPVVAKADKNKKLWEQHVRARAPHVRVLTSKCSKVFTKHRAHALQALEKLTPENLSARTPQQRSSLIDLIFNWRLCGEELFEAITPGLREIGSKAAAELNVELGAADDAWKFPSGDLIKFLSERTQPVQDAGETARGLLNTQLEQAAIEGETMDEITARVKEVFNGLAKHEARRIAMTETNIAYNTVRDAGMKANGVKFKAWLSSHGPNVRASHRAAEDNYGPTATTPGPIAIDEAFQVAGEALMFPGDPEGSAGNIINCQCIQLAVKKKEEA